MSRELRLLLVEDSADDAELLLRELRRGGFEPTCRRVETEPDMREALAAESWDLIISDYAMPTFSGIGALELARKYGSDVPFIIVSGTIGEDIAVAAMKAGAHDYVMKDNLARLSPAIKRELREASLRRERQHARAVLFQEKERAHVTLASIGDGVITTNIDGLVEYLNPVAEELTGWSNEEARHRSLGEVLVLIEEGSRQSVADPAGACLRHGRTLSLPDSSVLVPRDRGQQFIVELTISPLRDHRSEVIGCVLVLHDVTELRGMARQMSYQATHDALTGLVNRREFEVRLEAALESARRERYEHAMCYLDLDQFKVVNDTCGHIAGDELLKALAAQLRTVVRETDTLARLGGDEFGVLLESCPIHKAQEIADDLRNIVKAFRFVWRDNVFDIGVSIGLVPITATSGGLADVLSAADSACYIAKDHGRNRVHIFQIDDIDVVDRHGEMQWVSHINQGMDEGRFVIYSQAIVPLQHDNGSARHYELLIRLRDREGNLVLPGKFIPAAERYNLMPKLDQWLIVTAFKQLRDMLDDNADFDLSEDMCAINLSGTTLSDDHFLDFIQEMLADYRLPPRLLCFEITETAAIANLARADRLIRALKGLGCRFALDDFGTGLSSFAYLKNLPVDFIKIDGSFVRDMCGDPMDRAIVASINQIGHVMGIRTIAEWVEDDGTRQDIADMGIDFGQGYGIEPPRRLEEMLAELARGRRCAAGGEAAQ